MWQNLQFCHGEALKYSMNRLLQNIDISQIIDIKKNIEYQYSLLLWIKYQNSDIIDDGKNVEVFEPKQSSKTTQILNT